MFRFSSKRSFLGVNDFSCPKVFNLYQLQLRLKILYFTLMSILSGKKVIRLIKWVSISVVEIIPRWSSASDHSQMNKYIWDEHVHIYISDKLLYYPSYNQIFIKEKVVSRVTGPSGRMMKTYIFGWDTTFIDSRCWIIKWRWWSVVDM